MTPKQYCYQKAAPLGSSFYFSLRKIPYRKRNAVTAIWSFYREIEDIILADTDPQVAQTKLNWWRQEVALIQVNKPTHPVALFLKECDVPISRLFDIISGLEECLSFPLFATFEDVVIFVMRTAGQRELLIAEMLGDGEILQTEDVYQLTLIVELVYYMQHLHKYVRRDLIYFSQDEMRKFQVREDEFKKFVTTESIRKLLEFQAEKVLLAFEKIKKMDRTLIHLHVRCHIAMAVLGVMRDSRFEVLENFIDITPLRSWWVVLNS